jgi:RNA polymerase sigma-70 factor (ECF subfamily)
MDKPDDELIGEYRNGSIQALGVVYDRYSKPLYCYLLRLLGNKDEAEDLLQETFCRLVEKLDYYQTRGQFKAYIYRLAHNLAIDYVRRRKFVEHPAFSENQTEKLEQLLAGQASDVGNPFPDPAEEAQKQQTIERLVLAVKQLPEDQKQVVAMKHYSGLSFKEIAEILGIPINTALGRMHYAIKNLRKLLAEWV